ncbi:MAG: hypothetical protein ACD_3C00235G0004 [uncultured bacterium (gcode 4)]|uniref:Uncharacterized protein n=1 Tax=uncultured bacterium (gcode 4) TaxID=1234023 RepID=K2GVA5_9BACT|nr:MAG: hypothetical protein ACD_3C00235G0004 [uncultured bacterium (gcode 4)]
MRASLKIFIVILAMSGFSFVSAAKTPPNFVKAPQFEKAIKNQDFIFEAPTEEKAQEKAQKVEQKNETKEEKEQDRIEKEQEREEKELAKAEREKIVKNLNNMLIESYKVKFSKILGNLSYNIKDKSADDKIKIFSTVLITTNSKIEEIDANKTGLSENKKEVLEGILNHIKSTLEKQIEDVAKKK